jgi:hypothetical protein
MPLVVPYRSAISLRTSTWTATGEDHNARAARFSAAAEGAPAGRALPRELTYSTRSESASAGSGVRARSRRSGGRAAQCVREGVRPLEVVAVPSTSGENGRRGPSSEGHACCLRPFGPHLREVPGEERVDVRLPDPGTRRRGRHEQPVPRRRPDAPYGRGASSPGRCVVAFPARMTRSPCFVFAGSSAPGVNCERHWRRSRAHRA